MSEKFKNGIWKKYSENALAVILILGAAYAIYMVINFFWPVITSFIIGLLIAYLLKPAYFFLRNKKLPKVFALILTYLLFLGILAGIVLIIIPMVRTQIDQFVQYLPKIEKSLINFTENLKSYYRSKDYPLWVSQELTNLAKALQERAGEILSSVSQAGLSFVSSFFNLFLGLFISFYLLKDWEKITAAVKKFFHHFFGDASIEFLKESNKKVASFIRGQLLVAASVGILASIVLTIMKVPFAGFLGLLVAIFDLIPYFGPIFVGILATLISLTVSPALAVWTAVAMFVVQQVESILIAPNIVGRETQIHPVTVLFAFLVGAKLFGILGIILAVPVAGIIKVWIEKKIMEGQED